MAEDRVNKFVESLRGRQPPATVPQAQPAANGAAPRVAAPAIHGPALDFDPKVLAKLGHLELIAKTVVDGLLKLGFDMPGLKKAESVPA